MTWPSATRAYHDFITCKYRATDSRATGLSGNNTVITVSVSIRLTKMQN